MHLHICIGMSQAVSEGKSQTINSACQTYHAGNAWRWLGIRKQGIRTASCDTQADLDPYCVVVSFVFVAFPATFGFIRIVDLRIGGGRVFSHRAGDLPWFMAFRTSSSALCSFLSSVKGFRNSEKFQKGSKRLNAGSLWFSSGTVLFSSPFSPAQVKKGSGSNGAPAHLQTMRVSGAKQCEGLQNVLFCWGLAHFGSPFWATWGR